MKVSIAHDYLLQYGGAERVVATWSAAMPGAPIHTIAYDEESTFSSLRGRDIRAKIHPRTFTSRIEVLLPVLPMISRSVRVSDGDACLVSTSGWSHEFNYEMPTLAYVHSPARWLHAADDYKMALSPIRKLGLTACSPALRRADKRGMNRMSLLVANSRVTRDRIWRAYGREAEIVHPPVTAASEKSRRPPGKFPEKFSVVASRSRGYKNVNLAVEASLRAGLPCVVVGSGSDKLHDPAADIIGLGRVTDAELQWIYDNATVVIGSAHEDFGLTVLEAALSGTPAAAIPVGGYLETVCDGQSGVLAKSSSVEDLSEAVKASASLDRSGVQSWGQSFSKDRHVAALLQAAERLR